MEFIIIFFCIIASSFFSGIETGLLSADHLRIYSLKEANILSARAADFLIKKPERLLGTTLIGTNIAVVTASIVLNNYLRATGIIWLSWSGSLLLSMILLVFAEN